MESLEPDFKLEPEPQLQSSAAGGGPLAAHIPEYGGHGQETEVAGLVHTGKRASGGGAESAGGNADVDTGAAHGGGGTSRESEYKRKRRPRPHCSIEEEGPLACAVCGDLALGHNYDCVSCESCKSFFRRNVFQTLTCQNGGNCEISADTRRNCAACRYLKCIAVGMKRDYIFRDSKHGAKGNNDTGTVAGETSGSGGEQVPSSTSSSAGPVASEPSQPTADPVTAPKQRSFERRTRPRHTRPQRTAEASTKAPPVLSARHLSGSSHGSSSSTSGALEGAKTEPERKRAHHEAAAAAVAAAPAPFLMPFHPHPQPQAQPMYEEASASTLFSPSSGPRHVPSVLQSSHSYFPSIGLQLQHSAYACQRSMESTSQVGQQQSMVAPFESQLQPFNQSSEQDVKAGVQQYPLQGLLAPPTGFQVDPQLQSYVEPKPQHPHEQSGATSYPYLVHSASSSQRASAESQASTCSAPRPHAGAAAAAFQALHTLPLGSAAAWAPGAAAAATTTPPDALSARCSPRAMQEADRSLVTHRLLVQRASDPHFDLHITTECVSSSVMNSVTASVPRLSEEEMRAVHASVERSLHEARRPLSAEEARTLIRQPRDAYEFFAYAESNLAHSICALKHLPEFRALALATQRAVVKMTASALLRLQAYFHFDLTRLAFVHPVCEEYVRAGHEDDRERVMPLVELVNAELASGFIESAALLVNSANYAIGVRSHLGDDQLAAYLLVLLNVFSPHRFLGDAQILAAVVPLHARLLQFLRQYLESRTPAALTSRPPLGFGCAISVCSGSHPQSHSHAANAPASICATNQNLNLDECAHVHLIVLDLDNDSMLGKRLPALASTSPEQRARLRAMINYIVIHDRLDLSLLASLDFRQQRANANANLNQRGELNEIQSAEAQNGHRPIVSHSEDWRWLFAFCIAALNDVRVDEVSQQAYAMRLAMSTRYTPLVVEILSRRSPHPDC